MTTFGQILTITEVSKGVTYRINGTTTGMKMTAFEVDDSTVRIFNIEQNSSNDYKTQSNFTDFVINGINPTDVEDAVLKINNIIKKETTDVVIQDSKAPLMIVKASQLIAETTLTSLTTKDDYTINVTSATSFVNGQYLTIYDIENNRVFFSNILSINVLEITLDTPLDFEFPIGSFVSVGNINMNVDGSITPQIFGIRNPTGIDVPLAFDITRLIFKCLTATTVDLSKFGDIAGGLTRGIVIRKVDGEYRNIFNAKTNGELKNLMFDFDIQEVLGNQQDGFTCRITFAGQNKMGAVIRIGEGEDLQIIIQDDLTSLLTFIMIAEGSEVTD
ncbi:MAG: hypothetical protein QQN55_01020 [Nitrosopumilus sp.]